MKAFLNKSTLIDSYPLISDVKDEVSYFLMKQVRWPSV